MATADQIKSLIKAYIDLDDDRFKTVVLQIAAYEAKLNHSTFANELKTLSQKIGRENNKLIKLNQQFNNPLLEMQFSSNTLEDLIVSPETNERIKRILNEYINRNKLLNYGMSNRRRILLEGAPGTGKTFTASVIAHEVNLPLFTVQMDKLVTKFMGETSVKLRQIFDTVNSHPGVYFFDEFDAIGANRSFDNEVGEMRRILNSFLQFIEQDNSDSIIIAATNNQKLLDPALFRRFDDVIHYSIPTTTEIKRIYQHKILSYQPSFKIASDLVNSSVSLSHAEIINICDDAIKDSILNDHKITKSKLTSLINNRLIIYSGKEA